MTIVQGNKFINVAYNNIIETNEFNNRQFYSVHAQRPSTCVKLDEVKFCSCRPPSALCRSDGSSPEPDRQMDLSVGAC